MEWTNNSMQKKYEEYFSSEDKIAAFDKIAERYYCANFGTMTKSDFETLLFSIYLEQILNKNEADMSQYSDYTLSKILGITQAKVSSLKVKKELMYPYKNFKWQKSFERISEKAIYEKGKIMLLIPDRNLYLEIKNAIEESGGFVEVQLTRNLLQVRLEYFLDLLVAISDEKDRNKLRKEIKDKIKNENSDIEFMERESIGEAIKKQAPKLIIDLIGECLPVVGGSAKVIANNVYEIIKNR